jgi:uncharacterized membrane protein YphA (DoxX/SURF4 family)
MRVSLDGRGAAWARTALRLALALLFLAASVDKLLHPEQFAVLVENYRVLPPVLVNPVAVVLPWLELLLALALLLGRWLEGALSLSFLLLVGFWAVLLFNWARGVDVTCGCFSTTPGTAEGAHMAWYALRDGLFVLLAAIALRAHWPVFRTR